MERKILTCIRCPMGCELTVELDGSQIINISGNACKRGELYARKEITAPTRIVTSSVKVTGGSAEMVSVKTKTDIPKGKIFDCMKCLRDITVSAPVRIGDVIVRDAAGTGVDIVATKDIAADSRPLFQEALNDH